MVVKVKVRVKVKTNETMANIQISTLHLPADEGMRLALDMVKSKYVAEQMEGSDKTSLLLLSFGVNHNLYHGKPYYYPDKMVEELQHIITQIGTALMQVQILQDPQTQEDSPLCYGDDMVSKFKVLGKVIKLPYLFINMLCKTEGWQKMHLSAKKEKYYNHFTDAELSMINDGIRAIALKLCAIQLQH